jgi:hypothetical protein
MGGISLGHSHHCILLEQHSVVQTQSLWHSIIVEIDVPWCLHQVYELWKDTTFTKFENYDTSIPLYSRLCLFAVKHPITHYW